MKQVLSYYQRNKARIKNKARQTTLSTSKGVRYRGLKKRKRPDRCELCRATLNFKKMSERLEYHHWYEARPDLGLWLCFKHHRFAETLDAPNARVLIHTYYDIKAEAEQNFLENLT